MIDQYIREILEQLVVKGLSITNNEFWVQQSPNFFMFKAVLTDGQTFAYARIGEQEFTEYGNKSEVDLETWVKGLARVPFSEEEIELLCELEKNLQEEQEYQAAQEEN